MYSLSLTSLTPGKGKKEGREKEGKERERRKGEGRKEGREKEGKERERERRRGKERKLKAYLYSLSLASLTPG